MSGDKSMTNSRMSVEEAIRLIEEIPSEKRKTPTEYLKIYDRFHKQKRIPPEDTISLISKGITIYPQYEIKIIAHAYAKNNPRSVCDSVDDYIVSKCFAKFETVGITGVKEDCSSAVFGIVGFSERVSEFIKSIKQKNENNLDNKFSQEDLLPLVYIVLNTSIRKMFKSEPQKSEALLEMERLFIEDGITIDEKDLRKSTCRYLPQYLAKGQLKKSISQLCYLYYGYKTQSKSLSCELHSRDEIIAKLSRTIDDNNILIKELNQSCDKLAKEKELLISELDSRTDEKKQAEERLEFETNRIERQYQSQNQGLAKHYNATLGLEIDGIEDILEFLPEEARTPIKERVDRMRKIINDIGEV